VRLGDRRVRDLGDAAHYRLDIRVFPVVSPRARPHAPSRRFFAAVVVAAALFAVGCFAPNSSGSFSVHHDDPFLTCVRRVESGGNYQALSPGGQFRGAYQFLQSTWDATANHIGARDLVGLDPITASPTLQDDMAWALFQWQGTGPWAGNGC
jgi:hypothetical protein